MVLNIISDLETMDDIMFLTWGQVDILYNFWSLSKSSLNSNKFSALNESLNFTVHYIVFTFHV